MVQVFIPCPALPSWLLHGRLFSSSSNLIPMFPAAKAATLATAQLQ
uniref:Uncharacterized protein n=1 Tax=Arundo donax TaxID=35708 RepID=A0A0A9E922_ARUDO